MILPISIAPWQVIIVPAGATDEIAAAAEKIYNELTEKGVEVLLDDRDVRGGVKFKDADLLGIPVRITVGKRSLAQGQVEVKLRTESESKNIDLDNAAVETVAIVNSLKEKLQCGRSINPNRSS
jgi:prolyl-tRNA synthetase